MHEQEGYGHCCWYAGDSVLKLFNSFYPITPPHLELGIFGLFLSSIIGGYVGWLGKENSIITGVLSGLVAGLIIFIWAAIFSTGFEMRAIMAGAMITGILVIGGGIGAALSKLITGTHR